MPAISPARLQRDIDTVFKDIEDIDSFMRHLGDVLEMYADRTVRPSRSGRPASLLPAYHVPRPVIRSLENGLTAFADVDPAAAFRLSERLWAQAESEYKYLSVHVLSALPEDLAVPVAAAVKRRLAEIRDEALLEALFAVGVRVDLQDMLRLVEAELEGEPEEQSAALDHLHAIIRSAGDDTLPGIFRLLRRVMDYSRIAGSTRLLGLAKGLSNRAPVETAYFLRQQYLVALRPEYGRLIRQCMPAFPEHVQADLRRMLQENPVD